LKITISLHACRVNYISNIIKNHVILALIEMIDTAEEAILRLLWVPCLAYCLPPPDHQVKRNLDSSEIRLKRIQSGFGEALMKTKSLIRKAIVGSFTALCMSLFGPVDAFAELGCQTGASVLGNAYVRMNPMYAFHYGNLESYVTSNSSHFMAGADAIRCARALSQALMTSSFQAYDPADLQRQRQLNAQMGSMGISPGAQQSTASQQLYMMAQSLARLARTLPAAAVGDFGPYYTPTTEMEQLQIFAVQMFQSMMQDPSMMAVMRDKEPLIKEGAKLEYNILLGMAAELAAQ
jgi:hypothetical protein